MVRQHKVNRLITASSGRNKRSCCDCGKKLETDQSWYCSVECRNLYSKDFGAQTGHSLKEPYTDRERHEFDEVVKRRKKELQTSERAMIESLTPNDESPEAEKAMRELLNPSGSYYYSSDDL